MSPEKLLKDLPLNPKKTKMNTHPNKIDTIAIIGLGYVGLPLALGFANKNIKVLGLDLDETKISKLNNGTSYIKHIESDQIQKALSEKTFKASSDFSLIKEVQAVIICVPTPLNKNREPDLSYVINSGLIIGRFLQRGTLVVLESTTYPGTTEGELKDALEKTSGLKAGKDFYLAYSPEREDPGNQASHIQIIPKVVGGINPESCQRACELYTSIVGKVVPVSSCKVAESSKLLENIFRGVNIALVNELKVVYDAMGIDIWEVIDASKTKPFGFMPFYPGPGLGGHCIPIDPFYLTWKAREFEQHTRFIELAGEINTSMPNYVISRCSHALNNQSKALKGSRILILGMAYKANVDDDRESPSYVIMDKLHNQGAIVAYNDPFVPVLKKNRSFPQFNGQESQPIEDKYDLIILVTNHTKYTTFDFSHYNCALVDTRNCIQIQNKPARYFKA